MCIRDRATPRPYRVRRKGSNRGRRRARGPAGGGESIAAASDHDGNGVETMKIAAALHQAGVSRVLEAGGAGYADAVAGFDLACAYAPDVVVDAGTSADVASTVAVAADRGQTVTVLGSGHGRLHGLDGGMAITVRHLDAVDVDAVGRTARIGAGSTWGPVLAATAPHGLAALCGSAPEVGVVGYLLGGGLGPLASSLGFSSDHVRSFDVVTPADGAITVSADVHPDLFEAMRGGKGGFGVVTAVTVDLLAVSHVYGGGVYFDAEDAPAVLSTYAAWAPSLPDSTTTSNSHLRLPPSNPLPAALDADLPLSSVEIRTLGPATKRVPTTGDAVGGRSAAHLLNDYAAPDPTVSDTDRLTDVRTALGVVAPWRAPVNLVNFVGRANAADAVVGSWTPEQNDRLDSIRGRHDPDRIFPFARHGGTPTVDGAGDDRHG